MMVLQNYQNLINTLFHSFVLSFVVYVSSFTVLAAKCGYYILYIEVKMLFDNIYSPQFVMKHIGWVFQVQILLSCLTAKCNVP